MRNTCTMTISLPPQLAKKTQRIMRQEGRTRSELFREALRRYMMEQEEESTLVKELRVKAKRLGIKSEADIASIIDDIRI